MIQSKTPPTQGRLSQTFETISQDFVHPDSDKNLLLKDPSQSDEDCNKKLESLQKLQEITPEKPSRSLTFHQSPDSISFKKVSRLSRPNSSVADACYISERNLLLVVLGDRRTINIYSTINFNLIKSKKSQNMVTCINYSEHLQRILVGGAESALQIWNPTSFKIEIISPEKGSKWFLSVDYVVKSNVIVVKTQSEICVYNTKLENITSFQLPRYDGEWTSEAADFYGITPKLLLAVGSFHKQKRLYLINIEAKTLKECAEFFVPSTSCVKLTETSPKGIFSCLMTRQAKPFQVSDKWDLFALAQFTVHPETEKFAVCRTTLTSHFFSKMKSLKNSNYFFAQKSSKEKSNEIFILLVKKNQVEILHVISGQSAIILDKFDRYIMTKEQSSVVEIDGKNMISVYRFGCISQKLKDSEAQTP